MPLSRKKQTLYTSGLQSLLLVLRTFNQKNLESSLNDIEDIISEIKGQLFRTDCNKKGKERAGY